MKPVGWSMNDLVFKDFEPTRDEMIDTVYEAIKADTWRVNEYPTKEEIRLVYNLDKLVPLTRYYLQACLVLNKPIPLKQKDSIERVIDPEGYFKRLDSIEKQLKISFELFMSTNPSMEEAKNKLIQLSKDYWQEDLSPELAEKQIKLYYAGKWGL